MFKKSDYIHLFYQNTRKTESHFEIVDREL